MTIKYNAFDCILSIKLTIKILVAEQVIEKYQGQNIKEVTSDLTSQCGEERQ